VLVVVAAEGLGEEGHVVFLATHHLQVARLVLLEEVAVRLECVRVLVAGVEGCVDCVLGKREKERNDKNRKGKGRGEYMLFLDIGGESEE
jgi:hypothetical protein